MRNAMLLRIVALGVEFIVCQAFCLKHRFIVEWGMKLLWGGPICMLVKPVIQPLNLIKKAEVAKTVSGSTHSEDTRLLSEK